MARGSLGGSVAFELQKNHAELISRAYSAPVIDLAVRPNAKTEKNTGMYWIQSQCWTDQLARQNIQTNGLINEL